MRNIIYCSILYLMFVVYWFIYTSSGSDFNSVLMIQLSFLLSQFISSIVWMVNFSVSMYFQIRTMKDLAFKKTSFFLDFLSGFFLYGIPLILLSCMSIYQTISLFLIPLALIPVAILIYTKITQDSMFNLKSAIPLIYSSATAFIFLVFVFYNNYQFIDTKEIFAIIFSSLSLTIGIIAFYYKPTLGNTILSSVFLSFGCLFASILYTFYSLGSISKIIETFKYMNLEKLYYPMINGVFILPSMFNLSTYILKQNCLNITSILSSLLFITASGVDFLMSNDYTQFQNIILIVLMIMLFIVSIISYSPATDARYSLLNN